MKKLKIAFIVTKLSKAAPILYVQSLVNYLMPFADLKVYYFDDVVELQFPCPVERIRFTEKVDFNEYDIVHSHGFRPDIYTWRNKNSFKGKKVSTIHSYIHYDIKSQYNGIISFVFCKIWLCALNRLDNVITLTNDMKLYYETYLKRTQLKFIHSGHDLPENYDEIAPNEVNLIKKFKGKTTLIGVIANLRKQKGINQIIDAIGDNKEYSLLIIGDGNVKRDLEIQAAQNGCQDRCLFIGHKEDAFRYLEFIDIYAMTSYQEGFGLVNLEAALYKKPVICSNINVFNEIFNENCVCFFELDNKESFLTALLKLRFDYDSFSQNLHRLVSVKYTPKCMGNEYLLFYNYITDNN